TSDEGQLFPIPFHISRITHHASRIVPADLSARPSKLAARPSERGIALVIVMISIFVLTILAVGFAFSMKVETKLAQHANNETEMQWLGRSGVEYSRWILAQPDNCPGPQYDALNQVWAGGGGSP